MWKALIDPNLCQNCAACAVAAFCTEKAILREDRADKPWVNFLRCRGCMKCIKICPNTAVLEEISP